MACSVLVMSAMPAYRGKIKRVQPDGTVITTLLMGDEHRSCITTTDGYAIQKGSDGYYHYLMAKDDRTFTVEGAPVARSVTERSASDRLFLQKAAKASALLAQPARTAPKRVATADSKMEFSKMRMRDFPAKGNFKGLVVLAQFQNAKFTYPKNYFDRLLNEEGFSENGAYGSAHDYYYAQSMGQFNATFDVVGPVTLSHDYAYYGVDSKNIFGYNTGDKDGAKAIAEAVQLADSLVDYSQYDKDGDGKVDMVYVIYAGYGENFGADPNTIWPHQYELSEAGYNIKLDGKTLDTYACSAELYGSEGQKPCGIGPLCHEFGHVLGFADHYNTSSSTDYELGMYDIMDYGAYNDSTNVPPVYNAFERLSLGWMTPRVIHDPADGLTLENIAESNEAYVIPTNAANQYYLLENHQQTGWDKDISGSGLMITHLDFDKGSWTNNTVNTTSDHRRFYLVCADNDGAYDAVVGRVTEKNDLYPYRNNGVVVNDAFTDESTPAAETFGYGMLDHWITDVRNNDGVVTFNYRANHCKTPTNVRATAVRDDGLTLQWDDMAATAAYNVRYHKMVYESTLPVAYTDGKHTLNASTLSLPMLNLSAANGQFAVIVKACSDQGHTPVFTVSANGKQGRTRLSSTQRNYIFHFDNGLTQTGISMVVAKDVAHIDSIVVVRGDGSAFSGNAYRVSVTGTAASTTNVEVSDSLIAVDTTEVEGIETNQLVFDNLEKDAYYGFEVQTQASDNLKESPWSAPYIALTNAAAAVTSLRKEEGVEPQYFTIEGLKLNRAPQCGFYIEKRGKTSFKKMAH